MAQEVILAASSYEKARAAKRHEQRKIAKQRWNETIQQNYPSAETGRLVEGGTKPRDYTAKDLGLALTCPSFLQTKLEKQRPRKHKNLKQYIEIINNSNNLSHLCELGQEN